MALGRGQVRRAVRPERAIIASSTAPGRTPWQGGDDGFVHSFDNARMT
jgi:hypothetical protein